MVNESYTRDRSVAIRDAIPATMIVAWANFWPVPPSVIVDQAMYGRLCMTRSGII